MTKRGAGDRGIDFAGDLNPAQLAAATAEDGPHLVVAGAGTGKTRALVYRVAYLVERGVVPESILLLTFTRRAAGEMLRRAAGLLDERCQRVAGGTYHSFANLTLRQWAEQVGFARGFTILDRSDAIDMIGILRAEAGHARGKRRFPRAATVYELLSKAVNTHRPLAELLADDAPQLVDDHDAVAELGERYSERKRQLQVMDYDDLLVHLRDLLAGHREARRALAARYRYILVDEFQDTNRLQAQISALLAAAHGNIMVVGDDAQSIYSFRGAEVRNILDFPKVFPDCRQTVLERNYRSAQPILELGNAILRNAEEGYAKRLHSEIEGTARPVFVRTPDEQGQAEMICERVLELREEGVPLAAMAVLARAAWHTNTLELTLQNRNIPFRKFGGLRFAEAAHVKDLVALLKLGLNPLDGPAWFRVLQLSEGIGQRTAQRLTASLLEAGGDRDLLVAPAQARSRYAEDLRRLHRLLCRGGDTLAERLEHACDAYLPWMKRAHDDARRRAADLDSLRVLAERYTEVEPFLSDLAIDPPDFTRQGAAEDQEDEWLTLTTIHSAKGLEWHTVFVVQLAAGRFPPPASRDDYEEERRLFYVAVTRAQRGLYLIKPEEVRRGAYHEIAELSPLIAEIDGFDRLAETRVWGEAEDGGDWDPDDADDADEDQLQRIADLYGGPVN